MNIDKVNNKYNFMWTELFSFHTIRQGIIGRKSASKEFAFQENETAAFHLIVSLDFRGSGLLVFKYLHFFSEYTLCTCIYTVRKKVGTIQCGYKDFGTDQTHFETYNKYSRHKRKRSPNGLSLPNQNTIIMKIIW